MQDLQEGSACPECWKGTLFFKAEKSCSCHINPPCSACVNAPLTCNRCGWKRDEEPSKIPPPTDYKYMPYGNQVASTDLGSGKRLFDYKYDSSSGSTMVWSGRYEGDVTAKDIIEAFGDGTFGHRGPTIGGGRFTYTKITD